MVQAARKIFECVARRITRRRPQLRRRLPRVLYEPLLAKERFCDASKFSYGWDVWEKLKLFEKALFGDRYGRKTTAALYGALLLPRAWYEPLLLAKRAPDSISVWRARRGQNQLFEKAFF
jgi:hypothetical protein